MCYEIGILYVHWRALLPFEVWKIRRKESGFNHELLKDLT